MEVTSVNTATTVSKSLRTTVPNSIVRHFDLKDKDRIKWELRPAGDRIIVEVSPFK